MITTDKSREIFLQHIDHFRKKHRPTDEIDYAYEFDMDLDRLVQALTSMFYHDAQAPFVYELNTYRDYHVRNSSLVTNAKLMKMDKP